MENRLGHSIGKMERADFMSTYYRWPNNGTPESVESVTKRLFSFVFVREPFSRLFSGYRNKLVHSNWTEDNPKTK